MNTPSKEELQTQQNYRLIEAMETSGKRYKALFQASSAAIMILKDGKFSDCNQATVKMFGCASKEEFFQFTPADLSPEFQPNGTDSESAVQAHIATAMKQGHNLFDWTHSRRNGTEFPTSVQLSLINVGDHTELQAIVTDLSAIKKVREALHNSETRYKHLATLIPDAVGIHRDGVWIFANQAALDVFGAKSMNQLLGTPVVERVHHSDRPKLFKRMKMATEKGIGAPLAEMKLLKLDGSEFWGEIQTRIFDDGQPSVLVVMRDVTNRVLIERENNLLRQAIEQSTEPMMILDAQGVVKYCNQAAAKMYAQTPNHIIGNAAAELRGGSIGDHIYDDITDAIQRGENWEGELTLQTESNVRMIARRVSPVFDTLGHVAHQIVVDREITEERKQQEKMEHVQRLESLGVLAGGIAHDFNNLLTAIMGHAALARSQSEAMHASTKHLEAIEDTSQRAADLCKQMLAYSGKGKFVIQPVNLSELVEEMLRLLEVSIHKSVVMHYELASNLPAIEADLAQMQQVIMNLVINANEAIGEFNGNITISTYLMQIDSDDVDHAYIQEEQLALGSYVCLKVSDTGCGMNKETKQRIFDPFFTTKFTGRGLGMSAVLGIVRGHHGAIKLYSEENKGTTMKLLFPVVDQDAISLIGKQQDHHSQGNGTVLIVDDEEIIREVASMMLEEAGYRTLTAVDGIDAIEQLKLHLNDIDCVLLDMTMPRMGGEETFTEMRRIRPKLKVLLSSGYNEQTVTEHFTSKGIAGFVAKPYMPEMLLAKVSAALGCGK